MQRVFVLALALSVAVLTSGCASFPSNPYQSGAGAYGAGDGSYGAGDGSYGAGDNSYHGGGLPSQDGSDGSSVSRPPQGRGSQECDEPPRSLPSVQSEPASDDGQAGESGSESGGS